MSNTEKDRPENAAAAEDKATTEAAEAVATASTATGAAGEQPGANQEQPMTGRASAEQRALEAIYLPARTQDKS